MPSPKEIAKIRAEIVRLEKAREQCADSGIRRAETEIAATRSLKAARPSFTLGAQTTRLRESQ
jgi:hypothetical protein